MVTLQTEFSLEDIEIARDVINTYPSGLSRVALRAPDQVYNLGSSVITKKYKSGDNHICYRTLKFQYAFEVWLRAVTVSQDNPSPLLYY